VALSRRLAAARMDLILSLVHLRGAPAPARCFLPELIGLIWNAERNGAHTQTVTVPCQAGRSTGNVAFVSGAGSGRVTPELWGLAGARAGGLGAIDGLYVVPRRIAASHLFTAAAHAAVLAERSRIAADG
jgi:hypothetical protein